MAFCASLLLRTCTCWGRNTQAGWKHPSFCHPACSPCAPARTAQPCLAVSANPTSLCQAPLQAQIPLMSTPDPSKEQQRSLVFMKCCCLDPIQLYHLPHPAPSSALSRLCAHPVAASAPPLPQTFKARAISTPLWSCSMPVQRG